MNTPPKYLPGFEPDDIKPLLDVFLKSIKLDYPNNIINISNWNHEKYDRAASMLCNYLGYELGKDFFVAYGYKVIDSSEKEQPHYSSNNNRKHIAVEANKKSSNIKDIIKRFRLLAIVLASLLAVLVLLICILGDGKKSIKAPTDSKIDEEVVTVTTYTDGFPYETVPTPITSKYTFNELDTLTFEFSNLEPDYDNWYRGTVEIKNNGNIGYNDVYYTLSFVDKDGNTIHHQDKVSSQTIMPGKYVLEDFYVSEDEVDIQKIADIDVFVYSYFMSDFNEENVNGYEIHVQPESFKGVIRR